MALSLSHAENFNPRWYQREFMLYTQNTREARAMAVWPRRSGKDLTALEDTLAEAHDTVGLYWHCLPVYEQARKACWTAFVGSQEGARLMDYVFPREVRIRPNEYTPTAATMLVELKNGSVVQFVGSDTIDRLVGSGPRRVNFSEFALSKPTAWPLVQPMLVENHGKATFLFTPRARNHAWKLFEAWRKDPGYFVSYHDIFDIGIYTEKEAQAILARAAAEGMPEELIQQEYLCSFTASLVGSYYGRLLEALELKGALGLPFEHPRDGIITAWDLGISDSTAIWVYRLTSSGADFIAHYEANGHPISHYLDWLDRLAETLGLEYSLHVFPHDAKARSLVTGQSVLEHAAPRLGVDKMMVLPAMSLLDGIEAARWLLQQTVRFHQRCADHDGDARVSDGIEALRQYHKKWDDETKSFGLHPEHDWTSHTADAFRMAALSIRLAGLIKKPSTPTAPQGVDPGMQTFDDLLRSYRGAQKGRRV
jgi:phage terminase large subunit